MFLVVVASDSPSSTKYIQKCEKGCCMERGSL